MPETFPSADIVSRSISFEMTTDQGRLRTVVAGDEAAIIPAAERLRAECEATGSSYVIEETATIEAVPTWTHIEEPVTIEVVSTWTPGSKAEPVSPESILLDKLTFSNIKPPKGYGPQSFGYDGWYYDPAAIENSLLAAGVATCADAIELGVLGMQERGVSTNVIALVMKLSETFAGQRIQMHGAR